MLLLPAGAVNNCTDPAGGWALGCRIDGGQAEYVRVPYADNGLTRIPDGVSDRQALFTGDILSTGFWAAQLGEIREGDTVAVLGAGPTGLCAMMCARLYRPACIVAGGAQSGPARAGPVPWVGGPGPGAGGAGPGADPRADWRTRRGRGHRGRRRPGYLPNSVAGGTAQRDRGGGRHVRGKSDPAPCPGCTARI